MSEDSAEKIQSDHYPEAANKATRRLELLKVKDKLRDPQERRDFFKNLSDERFKKMLGYINSLTRATKISDDYEDGQTPLGSTPTLEDKEALMKETFEAVRNILANENLDNNSALQVAGLTLAGAVNYIHPYKDGNGRVGRVAHYLMEFGNQRGDDAFQDELYSIIAKLPMYNTDKINALYDTPPPELERALGQQAPRENATADGRKQASERVKIFLKMMQGKVRVPIEQEVSLPILIDNVPKYQTVPAGEIDGAQLYLKSYLARSSIPNRGPKEIPQNSKRVIGEKNDGTVNKIAISMDLV